MPKFIAQTPIKHNGKRHAPGAQLEMSAKDAAALPPGSVVAVPESKTQGEGKGKTK